MNHPTSNYAALIKQQQLYFASQLTRTLNWRKQQLNNLQCLLVENEQQLAQALYDDLAKPYQEAWLTEISYLTSDIKHTLKQLKNWQKRRKVSATLLSQPAQAYVYPEPVGVVLIIGAWNYPLQLLLTPLIAVIASGNCALLKPSELAPATSKLLTKLIPQYLDDQAIKIVEGAAQETTALLTLKFDHIMYTGNSQVARIVMNAAAKHLTPVTLELGGKNPVFIDETAILSITARRIAWGKWMNCGQTCIAPDYLLTTKTYAQQLINELTKQITLMYGDNPKQSDSYGRIVNQRHCQRLVHYLENEQIVYGGAFDIKEKFIAPTLILNPSEHSKLLSEEIFGPILPIITVDDFNSAIEYILLKDKPLAAYLFTKNKQQEQIWLNSISAGNVGINDVMMFTAIAELPFGGIGESGMGQYSGKAGFDNFSHLKTVIKRPFIQDFFFRFAPFNKLKLKILKWLR